MAYPKFKSGDALRGAAKVLLKLQPGLFQAMRLFSGYAISQNMR
jgi:hypothetical protein